MAQVRVLVSIVLVAALTFIVCALALFVATRLFPPKSPARTVEGDAKSAGLSPAKAPQQAG